VLVHLTGVFAGVVDRHRRESEEAAPATDLAALQR
jgi:hypothetical protein